MHGVMRTYAPIMRTNMKKKPEISEYPHRLVYGIADTLAVVPIKRSKLYEEMRDGRLRSFCIGKRRLIDAADLIAWLNSYKQSSK